MSDKDSLGDRMKEYERCSQTILTRRIPAIIRLDGKAFHTFTKKMDRPFDNDLQNVMLDTAQYLVKNIQNCKLAYTQSDEISLMLIDYERLETSPWFGNKVQKIVSIASAIASVRFNDIYNKTFPEHKKTAVDYAIFDARVWSLPVDEVCNYFVWRQQDATRNSVQMLAQSHFSDNELHGVSNVKAQDMLIEHHGINWNNTETYFKRGGCVRRIKGERQPEIDNEIPIFTKDREYIEQYAVFSEDVE